MKACLLMPRLLAAFAWETRLTPADTDGLLEVTVTVSWSRKGKDRSVSLVSLLVEK